MRITRKRGLDDGLDDGLDAPDSRRPRGSWLGWMLPIVLTVLLVGVATTSVVLLRDRRVESPEVELLAPADVGAAGGRDTPAGEAVASAATAATTYFTLDYRSLDADMARMRALGTPAFGDDYDADTAELSRRVVDEKIAISADLPRDGVATEYLTEDVAQVMVAVDVTTRRAGTARTTSSTTAYRTRVTLELTDGSWLVSAIDEVA